MPAYDYECERCGVVEVWHRMSERADACPKCGSKSFTKLVVQNTNFIPPWDTTWGLENGGRGHYFPSLGLKPKDPNAYCRTEGEFREKVARNEQKYHRD